MGWALVLAVAAGCGPGHDGPPDAAPNDAAPDAEHDAGEDAGVDAGRPCSRPPAIIGTLYLEANTGRGSVAAQGRTVLVSTAPALLVVDASDPTEPVVVNELYPEHAGGMVHWTGDRAAVQLDAIPGSGWYALLDMSEPQSPVELGAFPDGDYPSHMDPPVAFGLSLNSLVVFDVAERSAPTVVARHGVGGAKSLQHLAVAGDTAFLVEESWGEDYGIDAIDISDPTVPQYVGVVVPPTWSIDPTYLRPLPGELLYYRQGSELRLLDVSEPANARLLGTVDAPEPSRPSILAHLPSVAANLLFFSLADPDSPEGWILGIAPLEDPLEPRIEWTVRIPSPFWMHAVSEGLAYLSWNTGSPSEDVLGVIDLGCAVQ